MSLRIYDDGVGCWVYILPLISLRRLSSWLLFLNDVLFYSVVLGFSLGQLFIPHDLCTLSKDMNYQEIYNLPYIHTYYTRQVAPDDAAVFILHLICAIYLEWDASRSGSDYYLTMSLGKNGGFTSCTVFFNVILHWYIIA